MKRSKIPADTNTRAFAVVQLATGQVEPEKPKSAAAVKRGSQGGKARAAKLSSQKRKAIAKEAAAARWSSPKGS